MAAGRDDGIVTPMRQAAQAMLPALRGVFLRCDRGDALYVTNAPQRMEGAVDWQRAGFDARIERGLCFLTPGGAWVTEFCRWAQDSCDDWVERLSRAAQDDVLQPEDMALWAAGVKLLEMGADAAQTGAYEKRVRQRAAVCMREKRGGGTLRAAALCIAMMKGDAAE